MNRRSTDINIKALDQFDEDWEFCLNKRDYVNKKEVLKGHNFKSNGGNCCNCCLCTREENQ